MALPCWQDSNLVGCFIPKRSQSPKAFRVTYSKHTLQVLSYLGDYKDNLLLLL